MSHPIQFGYCVPIFASPGGRLFRTPNAVALDSRAALAGARLADTLGYDSIWVADHLMLGQDFRIVPKALAKNAVVLQPIRNVSRRAK